MSALATLPLAFSGLALIGLSMDRHARQAGFAALAGRQRLLRIGGWALIALSLVAVLAYPDWRFRLVEWVGLAGAGAGLVVLTLLYRPKALMRAAIVSVAIGLAGLIVGG